MLYALATILVKKKLRFETVCLKFKGLSQQPLYICTELIALTINPTYQETNSKYIIFLSYLY